MIKLESPFRGGYIAPANSADDLLEDPHLMGEHTEDYLTGLGYAAEKIAAWKESGII